MKTTRRKFSAGFKAQAASEALKEWGSLGRVAQAF